MGIVQRGRKSAAALALPSPDGNLPPLQPPASLSAAERIIFKDIVAACGAKHFRASDLPLLVRYVEACALADEAAQHLREEGTVIDGKASAWLIVQEKSVRAITALSMRLRLSPQSRLQSKSVGREPPPGPRPWS